MLPRRLFSHMTGWFQDFWHQYLYRDQSERREKKKKTPYKANYVTTVMFILQEGDICAVINIHIHKGIHV